MNKTWRFLCLFVLVLFSFKSLYAQPDIKTKNIEGCDFIKPDVELLIHMLEQDYDEWISFMESLSLNLMDKQDDVAIYGKSIVESDRGFIQGISKNRIGLVSMDFFNFGTDSSMIEELEDLLKPYFYTQEEDGIAFYIYKRFFIAVKRDDNPSNLESCTLREQVYIKYSINQ